MSSQHKYNTGIIGNCGYIAHVDSNANIPWMCLPRFDSSPVFGSLLDPDCGNFSITSDEEIYSVKQEYIQNTNIISTEFHTSGGKFRVIDFAPRFYQDGQAYYPLTLCRKVERLEGNPKIKIDLNPKYHFGKESPEIQFGSDRISYVFNNFKLRLYTNFSHNYLLNKRSEVLSETKYFVLTYGFSLNGNLPHLFEEYYHKTKDYWQNWVKHCSIGSFAAKEVIRSALVLKIHQYQDTGAIIASSTTSLPEANGSGRNWDYRFCWIRDSYYTLQALTRLGHFEEMESYANYIANLKPTGEGRYQPLYSITGETLIAEEEIPIKGYLGNTPVRVGNQAYTHIQNDAYGQILLSLLPLYLDERLPDKNRYHNRTLVKNILNQIEATMEEPDAGLWEFRNLSQNHCYTYLFHWAGAKATIKIAESLEDLDLKKSALSLLDKSKLRIEKCFDPNAQAYTQAIGTKHLDASLLQLITMSYLKPQSETAHKHLEELERKLKTKEGLFFRYLHNDDFGKPDSTFLVCAFWYIESLACLGKVEEASELFYKMIEHSNHLGLFSEDVDAKDGSQWGNFPQTYSHVGLVNAAFRISQKKGNLVFE
ncbi:glycoside hydrolase family 15 protein [Leptospira ilyithenensis]|uniref:Glycoside hydrolase family 15 protein n=1 Tax=Leptospira ilyithenensis TaxID=2484901 RepID=A0A4R9LQM8_9LEPT|nr:glycoside hydrolase family 15 protein [Leptospira ilyithenensis]TGN10062.1 glycoside hydrolase family 15 protein [Leptospira ilyithenensis]